jgi:hypothetical protein
MKPDSKKAPARRKRSVSKSVVEPTQTVPKSKARLSQEKDLTGLPKYCTFEGNEPELKHLRGLYIPTAEIQRLVPVGARENIWVVMPDGSRERPWLNTWITEYDEDGNIVGDVPETRRIAKRGPRAMGTAELGALGMTDHDLDMLSREVLGIPWEPDSLALSDLRRERFDQVFAILMRK